MPRSESGLLNFGWDVYEGTRSFEDKPLGPGKLVQPVHEYSHNDGCSVTGGYVYRGRAIPRIAGRYFFGDYCSGDIWSLQARRRQGDRGAQGGDRGAQPRVVRRGKPRVSSTSCRTTARSTASPDDGRRVARGDRSVAATITLRPEVGRKH